MSDDSQLLGRFAAEQDQDAFATLVQRHVNLVYSAALRQVGGDAHLAWDASQSVFLALAQNARRLVGHAALTGWLYTTTRNICAKIVRARHRARAREEAAFAMNDIMNQAAAEPDWSAVREVIDSAMHELNAREREALLLRHFEDRSFAEIGRVCGLEENAARMRVERALEKLRVRLARRGITSTATALAGTLAAHGVSAAPAGLATAAANVSLATAASAAGALTWIQFMTATQLKIGAAAVVCVIAAGGYYGLTSSRQTQNTTSPTRAEPNLAAARSVTPPVAASAATTMASVSPTSAAAATANRESPAENPFDHAALHQTMRPAIRGSLEQQYGELFQRLRLAPAELEKLKDLLVERQISAIDALGMAGAHGVNLDGDPAQMQSLLDKVRQDVDAGVRALLGEARFQHYQEFNRNASSYHLLDQIRLRLSRTEEPLQGAQAESLLRVLVDHVEPAALESFPGGATGAGFVRALGGDNPEAAAALRAPLSDAALAQARNFLTPSQMEALRQFQSDQREQAAGIRALMEKGQPKREATP